ncbi:MAG: cytochrome-c peroxidase, partial [Peristeroidobacter soli]
MKKKIFLGLLGVLLVFVAGAFYGRVSKKDVVISSSTGGASYAGGFKNDAAAPAGGIRSVAGPAPTNVVVVKDGESILSAVKAAPKGTIIRVMPGTYHETVYIDKDDIRIIGVIEHGKRPVLDGEKKLNDAILYSGNNF